MFTRKILIAAAMAAVMAVPAPAAAANTTTSNGRALLLLPLQLTKIDDMDFGTVVASTTSYGTVTLNPTTGTRSFTGGISGISSAPGRPAQFGGAGTGGQLVVIVLSPPPQLSDGNGHTVDVLAMSLDNLNNPLRVVHPVDKTFFVNVGGVLGINANQVPGTYSATFDITANYL